MTWLLHTGGSWGWRFVDTFCWRKTDTACRGGETDSRTLGNQCSLLRQQQIKFRPQAVSHESEDCSTTPEHRNQTPGRAPGDRRAGAAADGGKNQSAWQRRRNSLSDDSDGRHSGLARPSNVVEVKSESSQGSHSAPFPRGAGGVLLAGLLRRRRRGLRSVHGQRTTMAAAALLDRTGYGCEISPAYAM